MSPEVKQELLRQQVLINQHILEKNVAEDNAAFRTSVLDDFPPDYGANDGLSAGAGYDSDSGGAFEAGMDLEG